MILGSVQTKSELSPNMYCMVFSNIGNNGVEKGVRKLKMHMIAKWKIWMPEILPYYVVLVLS